MIILKKSIIKYFFVFSFVILSINTSGLLAAQPANTDQTEAINEPISNLVDSNALNTVDDIEMLDSTGFTNQDEFDSQSNRNNQISDVEAAPVDEPLNVRNVYKVEGSTPGMVLDSTFDVNRFTDHIMTVAQVNDSLRFNIQFNITEAADYQFGVYMYRADTNEFIVNRWSSPYLNAGTDHVVSIDFNGYKINDRGYSGYYNFNMTIQKYNGSWYDLLNNEYVHTSSFYDYSWFPASPTIATPFVATPVDVDGNGLYDLLDVSGELNIDQAGKYHFEAFIYENSTNSQRDEFADYVFLNEGVQQVYLRFAAWSFNPSVNDSYRVVFKMRQYYEPEFWIANFNPLLTTPFYFGSIWDEDPLVSGNIISAQGVDGSDGDGFFNYFEVTVDVNFRWAGYFGVDICIYDNDTGSHIECRGNYQDYSAGLTQFSLQFSSGEFIEHGKNASFRITGNAYLANQYWWYDHVDSIPNFYTREYYLPEWQPSGATILFPFSDYGIDTDDNGLYNYLGVDVTLEVNTPGRYRVNGYMRVDGENEDIEYDSASEEFTTPGTYILTLEYNGWDLLRHGWNNTLYIRYFNFYQYNPDLNQDDRVFYQTGYVYNLSVYTEAMFDPIPAVFTGIFNVDLIDTGGSSSKYEYIRIKAEIEVVFPGRFHACGSLYLSDDTYIGHSCSQEIDFLSAGTYFIPLDYYAVLLSQFSSDLTVRLNYIDLYDEQGRWTDGRGNYPFTFVLDPSLIEEPPIKLLDASWTPVDTDENGLYNGFNVNIDVNITQSGYYYAYAEFSILTDDCNFGWDTPNDYYTPGEYTFTMFVRSWRFLDCSYQNATWKIYSVRLYADNDEVGIINQDFDTFQMDPEVLDVRPVSEAFDFSSQGVNTDTDPLFDYLEVSYRVNVSTAGTYRFTGRLRTFFGSEYRGSVSTTVYLPVGTHRIILEFKEVINYKDINMNYTLYHYGIYDESDGWGMYYIYDDHHYTESYSYTDFDGPAAFFTGTVNFVPWDSTGLGGPPYTHLNVTFEVNITEPGDYYIEGYLCTENDCSGWEGNWFYDLTAGVHFFSISFPNSWVKAHLNENIYIGYVNLVNYNWEHMDTLANPENYFLPADSYPVNYFSHPWGQIIEILPEYGVDADGNGLIESIIIPVTIQANFPLYFELNGYLRNSSGYSSNWRYSNFEVPAGTHTVNWEFSTDEFFLNSMDEITSIGEISMHGYRTDSGCCDWQEIDRRYEQPLNSTYYLYTFDAPAVNIIQKTPYFEDIDSDGLYDYIVLDLTILSKVQVDLRLQSSLYGNGWHLQSSTNRKMILANTPTVVSLKWSSQVLSRIDPTYDTFELHINYIDLVNRSFGYWENLYNLNMQIYYPVEQRSAFDLNQFSYSINAITQVDMDGSGTGFNAIRFDFDIFVKEEGAYYLYLNIENENGEWKGSRDFPLWLNSGNNTISLHYTATAYDWDSGSNSYQIGSLQCRQLFDPNDYWEIRVPLFNEYIQYPIGTVDKSSWSDLYAYFPDLGYQVYVNGTTEIYDSVFLSIGQVLNITVVLNEIPPYPLLFYASLEYTGINVPLTPMGNNIYTGILKLTKVTDGFKSLMIKYWDHAGIYWENWYGSYTVLLGDLPEIAGEWLELPLGDLFEGQRFNLTFSFLHKNFSVSDVIVKVTSDNDFQYHYAESIYRNSTHETFAVYDIRASFPGINTFSVTLRINDIEFFYPLELGVYIREDQEPTIVSFDVPLIANLGDPVEITAVVTDDFGIDDVVIVVQESVTDFEIFSLSVIGTNAYGDDIYGITIAFNSTGTISVRLEVTDNIGQTISQTELINIQELVYLAPEILDFAYTPSEEEIEIGTEITFNITLKQSDAIITSVSMLVNEQEAVAFIKIYENQTLSIEIWEAKYTPNEAGDYFFDVTVLNTANKDATVRIIINIPDDSGRFTSTAAPGFDVLILLVLFAIVGIVKIPYRKKET
ncbi:MAG: hypothetical protein ACXAC7_10995 [Candidatus Hodarchaeales archaeon]